VEQYSRRRKGRKERQNGCRRTKTGGRLGRVELVKKVKVAGSEEKRRRERQKW